jgi:hypothetical protein
MKMMFMRKLSLNKYTSIFLMTFLIFLVGILISQRISTRSSKELLKTQKEVRNYLLSLDLQSEIASEYICRVDVFSLTEEKFSLGKQIDILEKNIGKENEVVEDLKQDYWLLSIRQWLLVKKFKEECDPGINIIIFFYSNKVNTSQSESQGYVLDYLYEKYPEKIVTYAFDIDENNPALRAIKTIYGIERAPSLVINEELLEGFQSKDNIENILN